MSAQVDLGTFLALHPGLTAEDFPMTEPQVRALAALAAGPVHFGNEHGITLTTARALERRGLCEVTTTVRHEANSWGRTVTRRDWTARTTA